MLPSARLIANPTAGSDEAGQRLDHLTRRLERAYRLDTIVTRGHGDARSAAEASALRGDERLFVAGGDGTLNEVLNGVAAAGALERVAIGLIPTGTGNDFASALHLPLDVDEAISVLLNENLRRVDLGEVNGRLFANVSAGGFIAEVSEVVDPALKDIAGRLAFLLGGARVLLKAEPFRCRIGESERDCLLFAVCNAPTIGGGRLIAPVAKLDDGELDVCVVESMDLVSFVSLLRRVANGTHLDVAGVEYFRSSTLALRFDRNVAVNVDGEVFQAARCDYRVLAGAAGFFC
jgi:diacylglycerol kinase (ATP)